MAGRAGRLAFKAEVFGRSVILAPTQKDADAAWGSYILGVLEPLDSAFESVAIADQVLALISSGVSDTVEGLKEFLFATFHGEKMWSTQQAKTKVGSLISDGVEVGIAKGLIEKKKGSLKTTPLGQVCAVKAIPIKAFLEIKKYVEGLKDFEPIDVLCL